MSRSHLNGVQVIHLVLHHLSREGGHAGEQVPQVRPAVTVEPFRTDDGVSQLVEADVQLDAVLFEFAARQANASFRKLG